MTTKKVQSEIDQLHNALLYMSEAIEKMGKGGEILAKTFLDYEKKYSEHHSYMVSKISNLEAQVSLLTSEFDKIKKHRTTDLHLVK